MTKPATPDGGSENKRRLRDIAAQPLEKILEAIDTAPDEADSLTWEDSADRAQVEQNPIKTRVMFYTLCSSIVALIVWSAFAEIDQVTRGEGKVIPSQQVQILQSLDGGVITDIRMREGDIVERDQLLVKLDATRFQSTLQESHAELLALKAKVIRLRAVVEGTDFVPGSELETAAPGLVEHERRLFETSQQELEVLKQIALQQITQREQELEEAEATRDRAVKTYSLASRELAVTRPLVATGAVSEVELLRLERDLANMIGERDQALAQIRRLKSAIVEAKQKYLEVDLNFKNDIREGMSIAMARLSVLEGASSGLSDRVKQTSVRSPVRGTIKRLFYNTIGGVVLPGKEIVEIIPLDDSLLLEARIKPQDIAFLHPGQLANVKFTAYDFVVYGGLDAKVEHIGADTVTDDKGNPFYIVRVRTFESSLGEGKPIIPGMVATVDVLTGKKTILAYMLKPLLRAKQYALTEE
ncbi:HlyD family type I secretion periplasmic adaptor subunit [Teredinibacter haidensis]|uniref:HlyD family type I secretion periplasmic adaptor subunit n=1 Tax=Teredinibacter haidensis TaxID=2731755 RepID=UPI0009488ED1|nr:HlyD family type I secretion periplasmic adaptor subunit [Teredinibacter haidensis]